MATVSSLPPLMFNNQLDNLIADIDSGRVKYSDCVLGEHNRVMVFGVEYVISRPGKSSIQAALKKSREEEVRQTVAGLDDASLVKYPRDTEAVMSELESRGLFVRIYGRGCNKHLSSVVNKYHRHCSVDVLLRIRNQKKTSTAEKLLVDERSARCERKKNSPNGYRIQSIKAPCYAVRVGVENG